MTKNNNQVSVIYTASEFRNLVEEYITQKKSEFTLKGVCSYILYWAIEDGKVECRSLIENDMLSNGGQERVMKILDTIIADGHIDAIGRGIYLKQ